MSETESQAISRLAANQIAKCVARGTVGALYVPIGVAKRAFPKTDQQHYGAALSLLEERDFIRFHKNRSCIGLNPFRYGEAVEFALQHADPKRRTVLLARSTIAPEAAMAVAPEEQDWSDDEDIERNDPILRESDVERLGLPRKDWVMQRIIEADKRPGNLDAGAVAREVKDLHEENHRLRSEVGTLRSQVTAMAEDMEGIRVALRAIDRDAKTLATAGEEMMEFVAKAKAARAEAEANKGMGCNVWRCKQRADKRIPVYHTNGFSWKQEGQDARVCFDHSRIGFSVCFHRSRITDVRRLMARLPKTVGVPLMCGPYETGRLLVTAMVEANRFKRDDCAFICGVDRDSEPPEPTAADPINALTDLAAQAGFEVVDIRTQAATEEE